MIGLAEINKIQSFGNFANEDIHTASSFVNEVIGFLCCNKLMRVLRFLFRKKFDEQYNKLSMACDLLRFAEGNLDEQWDLLEEYWDRIFEAEYNETSKDE